MMSPPPGVTFITPSSTFQADGSPFRFRQLFKSFLLNSITAVGGGAIITCIVLPPWVFRRSAFGIQDRSAQRAPDRLAFAGTRTPERRTPVPHAFQGLRIGRFSIRLASSSSLNRS